MEKIGFKAQDSDPGIHFGVKSSTSWGSFQGLLEVLPSILVILMVLWTFEGREYLDLVLRCGPESPCPPWIWPDFPGIWV